MEINCKYENNMILYTRCSEDVCVFLLSLPARWRGLKFATGEDELIHVYRCLRGGVD